MSVSTLEAGVIRVGNGAATVFSFSFEGRNTADIKVSNIVNNTLVPVASGFVATLNLDGSGGNVTFTIAPANGLQFYIYRDTAATQLVNVSSQSRYDPQVVERVWDKLTFLVQELEAEVERSVKTVPGVSSEILVSSIFEAKETALTAANNAVASENAAAASAMGAAISASTAALYNVPSVPTQADLATLTVEQLAVGETVWVQATGAVYRRVASGGQIDHTGTGGLRFALVPLGAEFNIEHIGAISNGTLNVTPFILAVVNAGFAALIPPPTTGWLMTTPLTDLPANARITGAGSRYVKIDKGFSGDLVTLGERTFIENLHFDDSSGSFTGNGLQMLGTISNQKINNCRVTGMDGPCIYFEKDAGSNIKADDVVAVRRNSNLQGRHAVVVENVLASAAIPRHFTNFSSEGLDAIDFGGAANFDVSGSFIGHVEYRANSKRVSILGGRGANATSITVRGDHHAIIGGDYNPQITVASGADANIIMAMSSAPNQWVIDQSGNGRNNIHYHQVTYPATLSAGGGGASLGNGTLIAKTSRTNNLQVIDIELTIGTTTNLGSGAVWFGLPSFAPNWSDMNQPCGWSICQRGGAVIIGTCFLIAGTQFLEIRRDTTGQITFNSPSVWAAGDIMRLKAIYTVG